MADRKRSTAPALPAPQYNSMIASAQLLTNHRINQPKTEAWQEEAWAYWDTCPELRFGVTWKAHAMSRVRLIPAIRKTGSSEPELLTTGPVVDAVDALAGGVGGQARMMSEFVIHLDVPGIGYLVGAMPEDSEGDIDPEAIWRVYSSKEIRLSGKSFQVQVNQATWKTLPTESHVCRVWKPHERFHWAPDSPCRAALPTLREIERLSQHIDAAAVSRLAGAGVFIVPQEATFPSRPEFKDAPDPFVAELMEVMSTAIRERGTAASIVPLVIKVPAQYVEAFKHLTFATPLDDRAIQLRDKAIVRLATGLDLPSEVILGMGDVNHWGQWQIEESAIKITIVPLAEIICHALTIGYLQPLLQANGINEPGAMIWHDISDLAARPDKSAATAAAYDSLEVSGRALRREIGLEEDDAPTPEELVQMVLKKIVSIPLLGPTALPLLGVKAETVSVVTGGPGPSGGPPAPEGQPEGTKTPPVGTETTLPGRPPGATGPQSTPPAAALVAASYPVVHRALEKAGNRMRSKLGVKLNGDSDCPPDMMHTCTEVGACGVTMPKLLEGAWDTLPVVAATLAIDEPSLRKALTGFTVALMEAGVVLTPALLATHLEGLECGV